MIKSILPDPPGFRTRCFDDSDHPTMPGAAVDAEASNIDTAARRDRLIISTELWSGLHVLGERAGRHVERRAIPARPR